MKKDNKEKSALYKEIVELTKKSGKKYIETETKKWKEKFLEDIKDRASEGRYRTSGFLPDRLIDIEIVKEVLRDLETLGFTVETINNVSYNIFWRE